MKKRFEFFLLSSVALGCLQGEAFAMNEEDFPQKTLNQMQNPDASFEIPEATSTEKEKFIKHFNKMEHKNQLQAYEEGAQKGEIHSCYALANYYYFGRQFVENPEDIKTSYYKNEEKRIYYKIGPTKVTAEDDEKAFDLYKKAAAQGHLPAIWSLGECYELQRGVKKNLNFAKSHYLDAANSKYPPAQRSLGLFYLDGLGGLEKSDEKAVRWFTAAASQGLQSAKVNLGMMHYLGRGGLKQSDAQALQYFREVADQGSAVAQAKMGEMYKNGRGVKKQDLSQAIKWFEKAVHQGYEPAQKSIEEIHRTNSAVPKNNIKKQSNSSKPIQPVERGKNPGSRQNPHQKQHLDFQLDILLGGAALALQNQNYKEALKGFLKASDLGDASAFNSVGLMYEDGQGAEKNNVTAAKYYYEAAKRGHAKGQANFARMCREGLGVPQDDFEAAKWYMASAKQGFGPAHSHLGMLYLQGRGVPQSDTEAAKHLYQAAQQGYGPAQAQLAELYRTGRGVMKSESEYHKWRNKAAKQGIDISSPGYPGTYFTEGVIQRDPEEVLKAANQGDIATQFLMGTMYRDGAQGVKQDAAEALKYYRKAADQGDILAQFCMGMMYMNGQGVEKNKDEGLTWIRKAAAQGDPNAQSMVANLSKQNAKKEQAPVNPEQAKQWQPSDGDLIQAGKCVMTLKSEMGKAPDANTMLAYVQKEMKVSADHGKIILEKLGLAEFD